MILHVHPCNETGYWHIRDEEKSVIAVIDSEANAIGLARAYNLLPDAIRQRDKLSEAVGWVIRDASYRAPETVTPELLQVYLAKLTQAIKQ